MFPLPLTLLASARPAGHTAALVREVLGGGPPGPVLSLLDGPLAPYCYGGEYPAHDTFPGLIEQVLQHDTLVLATPVYWYAMSGLLKTFFDRLTDLTTTHKPLGRQLRGKRLLALATGTDAALPPGFEEPFRRTARYLGLAYGGSLYRSQKYPRPAPEWAAARAAFRAAVLGSGASAPGACPGAA